MLRGLSVPSSVQQRTSKFVQPAAFPARCTRLQKCFRPQMLRVQCIQGSRMDAGGEESRATEDSATALKVMLAQLFSLTVSSSAATAATLA